MYKRQYKYQFAGSSLLHSPDPVFHIFGWPLPTIRSNKKPIKKSCLMKRALSRWTASTAKIKP